jgi:hypothetical protein
MQRVRENFTIWRTQPENQVWVMSVFVVLGGGVLLWIAWRLWQTRARVGADEVKELRPLRDNPWGEWEQVLVKKIGVRPLGMPYAQWLLRLAPEVGDETIRQMISLHNRWRYDPAPVEAGEGERLRRMMAMVLRRGD